MMIPKPIISTRTTRNRIAIDDFRVILIPLSLFRAKTGGSMPLRNETVQITTLISNNNNLLNGKKSISAKIREAVGLLCTCFQDSVDLNYHSSFTESASSLAFGSDW
jgi:hypothetical protein